jgi:hypothetical protein
VSEPKFIAQIGEPMSSDERKIWIRAQVEAAKVAGSVFFRVSSHEEFPDLLLLEGWDKQPDDQGEPRFQMVIGCQ